MKPPCPEPSALSAYADRRLSGPEREALEAHLAVCPDCLAEARDLARLLSPAPTGRLRWWAASAAALAVACLLLPSRRGGPGAPIEPGSPPGRETRLSWTLPEGGRAVLDRGGEARKTGASSVTLVRGRLWLDAGVAAVSVSLPGGEVQARDAELVVALGEGPSRASWIREAGAAGPPALALLCRRGSCRVTWGAETRTLEAGARFDAAPGAAPLVRPASPEALDQAASWIWGEGGRVPLQALLPSARGLSASLAGEALLLKAPDAGTLELGGSLPADYRLELCLRPRRAGGDLGLAFPALRRCPYWMLGAPGGLLPAGVWTRLVVERRGDTIRLWRNGRLEASFKALEADAILPSSPSPALGLWGAEAEMKDLRWRS